MEMSCAENVSANRTVWNKVTLTSKFTAEPDACWNTTQTYSIGQGYTEHSGLHTSELKTALTTNSKRGFCTVTFENRRHETQVRTFA